MISRRGPMKYEIIASARLGIVILGGGGETCHFAKIEKGAYVNAPHHSMLSSLDTHRGGSGLSR